LREELGSSRSRSDPFPYRRFAGAAILIAWLIPAGRLDRGPVLCPFRRLTGLPCPTCGLSRSWSAILHGRLGDSMAFHPLGPLTVIGAAAFAAGLDERVPWLKRRLESREVAGSIVAGWVAVWLVRMRAARR
jgi:hypothetical protein